MKEIKGIFGKFKGDKTPPWEKRTPRDLRIRGNSDGIQNAQEIANIYGFEDYKEALKFALNLGVKILHTEGVASDGSVKVLKDNGEIVTLNFDLDDYRSK